MASCPTTCEVFAGYVKHSCFLPVSIGFGESYPFSWLEKVTASF
ncbi:hypothetical protein [Archaeoglobus sulfaticallidus]|nr:hypothetical protein [Archaeoglobus sulfaticallidus]